MPSNCISSMGDAPCEARDERRVHSKRLFDNGSEICKPGNIAECDILVGGKRATDLVGEALHDERVLTEVEDAS